MTHDGEIILTYLSRGSDFDDPTWHYERWTGSGASRELIEKGSISHTAVLKMSPLWEERGFKVTIPAYELRF